tara:strand:+ start:128 stop:346 length:219 start_codon:yes stop_codon:yes gene_type:complete
LRRRVGSIPTDRTKEGVLGKHGVSYQTPTLTKGMKEEKKKITALRRQKRKKEHEQKRKGRFDHRTGRPGKSK